MKSALTSHLPPTGDVLTFDDIYEAWFDAVERWIKAHGVPDSELEDVAHEVFLVVDRKLGEFDGKNLSAWLYRICANTASDYRRRSWFKRLLQRPRDYDFDQLADVRATPAELLEQKEDRRTLHQLLDKMSLSHRVVFVLAEIEGYSGNEIATLLDAPLATVWTRLRRARLEFTARLEKLRPE